MRVKRFGGTCDNAVAMYNEWAKGKPITRDVIVHSHEIVVGNADGQLVLLDIVVFFDETKHTDW